MTAILGHADGEHVWIAGDSAANNSTWARFNIRERKAFRLGDCMIAGVSGRWRVTQLIQAGFILPDHPNDASDIDYLVLCFIPALQALLKKHDEVMANENSGTGITIGYRGTLYSIDSYYNVNAPVSQMWADGSGGDLALGALQAFLSCGVPVDEAMIKALTIAGEHNLTVDPPYYVEKL